VRGGKDVHAAKDDDHLPPRRAASLIVAIFLAACVLACRSESTPPNGGRGAQDLPEAPATDASVPHDTNHLADETSPYLLDHAHDLVDWYPWGEEAFEKARAEDKPIFLSIGYSSCHWCHVMKTESFEDSEVARLLNDSFVSILVDREERPEVDAIYLRAAEVMSGRGGWPLTIVMTSNREPFLATTYVPKEDHFGQPGLLTLLPGIATAWTSERARLVSDAGEVTAEIRRSADGSPDRPLEGAEIAAAADALASRFDPQHGGFLPAPKFPRPNELVFLLRQWRRTGEPRTLAIVERTLVAMADGGIRDQLGGGFHRYATDSAWAVPHFEKLLGDQAMIALAYTEAYTATRRPGYRDVAMSTLDYALRELRDSKGGFLSAEDADSGGVEGAFYLWSEMEIRKVLGAEADLFIEAYGIERDGNFPTREKRIANNVLRVVKHPVELSASRHGSEADIRRRLSAARLALLAARDHRVRPSKDDKILADWNGLIIAALARASEAFGEPKYAIAAREAAGFILDAMRTADGRLLHRRRHDASEIPGSLDDYAFTTWGLLDLYEATFDVRFLDAAIALEAKSIDLFLDPADGGFLRAPPNDATLPVPLKLVRDATVPSGNSVQMENLVRIARITGDPAWDRRADRLARAFSGALRREPPVAPRFLCGMEFAIGPAFEIVLSGDLETREMDAMRAALRSIYLPNKIVILRGTGDPSIGRIAPFTREQRPLGNRATAYVCTNHACREPTTDPAAMIRQLSGTDGR